MVSELLDQLVAEEWVKCTASIYLKDIPNVYSGLQIHANGCIFAFSGVSAEGNEERVARWDDGGETFALKLQVIDKKTAKKWNNSFSEKYCFAEELNVIQKANFLNVEMIENPLIKLDHTQNKLAYILNFERDISKWSLIISASQKYPCHVELILIDSSDKFSVAAKMYYDCFANSSLIENFEKHLSEFLKIKY